MEETVKRESIYNVPPATVLHTYTSQLSHAVSREDIIGLVFELKKAARANAK